MDTLSPPKGTDKKNWKPIKRLIFKSTNYGDDNDRALQKNDGSWTYFANDVAYLCWIKLIEIMIH